jgi:hypothetical protein
MGGCCPTWLRRAALTVSHPVCTESSVRLNLDVCACTALPHAPGSTAAGAGCVCFMLLCLQLAWLPAAACSGSVVQQHCGATALWCNSIERCLLGLLDFIWAACLPGATVSSSSVSAILVIRIPGVEQAGGCRLRPGGTGGMCMQFVYTPRAGWASAGSTGCG